MTIKNKLLVLDTSYTYQIIKDRGLFQSVTCRDIDGYFEHVWSVHPFASLLYDSNDQSTYGKEILYHINSRHTFVDGKIGLFKTLNKIPKLNFLISQFVLTIRLRSLIKREKISVIRAGGPLYVGLLGLVLSKLCSVPLLVRVGANYDKIYEVTKRPIERRLFRYRWIEKIIERLVLSNADMVAGANLNNLEFAQANGARPNRSTLFRYGNLLDQRHFQEPSARVDLKDFDASCIFNNDRRTIGYVGRLEIEKHPEDVIEVFKNLSGFHEDLQLLIIGDGKLKGALEKQITHASLKEKILFVGNKSQDWIISALPKIDIILSPHTGRALLECALAKTAVVAYDVDWQSELIETKKTGFLVEYRNIKCMTVAVDKLLRNRELRDELSSKLRERAMDMMSIDKLNEHEISVYSKLIHK